MGARRWSLIYAALGLFLLLWPVSSHAAVGNGKPATTGDQLDPIAVRGPDGKWHALAGGTGGGLTIDNPTQSVLYYYPSVIQNSTIPGNTADSTGTYDATGASAFYIDIYPTYDDSTGAELMALSYRSHRVGSGDSLSTYTMWPHPIPVPTNGQPMGSGAASDTLGSLKQIYLDNSLATPTTTLRRNEVGIALAPGPTPRGMRYGPFPFNGNFWSASMRAVQVYNASGVAYSSSQWPHILYKVDAWFVR